MDTRGTVSVVVCVVVMLKRWICETVGEKQSAQHQIGCGVQWKISRRSHRPTENLYVTCSAEHFAGKEIMRRAILSKMVHVQMREMFRDFYCRRAQNFVDACAEIIKRMGSCPKKFRSATYDKPPTTSLDTYRLYRLRNLAWDRRRALRCCCTQNSWTLLSNLLI